MIGQDGLIDHIERRKLAEAVRHFAAGRVTNSSLQTSMPASKEWALSEIGRFVVSSFYNEDSKPYKLIGNTAAVRAAKKDLARVVLFLRSGQPYRYQHRRYLWTRPLLIFAPLVFGLVQLGLITVLAVELSVIAAAAVEGYSNYLSLRRFGQEFWPFSCKTDFEAALANPVYLAGEQSLGQKQA